MKSGYVTTPFGRQSMTLGMLASQAASRDIEADKTVDKWKLFRALCEAKPLLGITDRALAVLNALLSFYPKAELAEEHGLIVFPSNAQLALRTHGMSEPTIRRHLAALIEAGLLIRKDSPNGKRYAHKGRAGQIEDAFGFSLAPLLARADEIEALAAQIVAERLHLQRLRERLTICRRDIAKLVDAAMEEGIPGDWMAIRAHQQGIMASLTRSPAAAQVASALDEMELLRDEVVNQLEMFEKTQKQNGNADQTDRHIQNSKPESTSEFEPSFEKKQEARPANRTVRGRELQMQKHLGELKAFPLGLVLQACPQIIDYGPGGRVTNWRDLMSAAVVVRSMLGVSPSAYQEACTAMGPENAATVMACILERGGHVNSAGGYLRELTRRTQKLEFGIGPMLRALINASTRKSDKDGELHRFPSRFTGIANSIEKHSRNNTLFEEHISGKLL